MRTALGDHFASALGRHTGTEAMAALANELARLICSFHGSPPVAITQSTPDRTDCWRSFKIAKKISAHRER